MAVGLQSQTGSLWLPLVALPCSGILLSNVHRDTTEGVGGVSCGYFLRPEVHHTEKRKYSCLRRQLVYHEAF